MTRSSTMRRAPRRARRPLRRGRLPRSGWSWLLVLVAGAAFPPALAQEPTFTFTKPAQVERPAWRSSVQLGVSAKTGNAESIGASVGARASRRTGGTRISGEVSAAYARSQLEIATDSNGVPGIGVGEIRRVSQTTSQAWDLQLRGDRYFGERNSLYVAAAVNGDRPAGKSLHAGGQVGYARALALSRLQSLTVELGYDVAHEEFVAEEAARTSQSARAFLGYEVAPSAQVELRCSAEVLANVAPESGPQGTLPPAGHARALGRLEADLKVNGAARVGMRIRTRFDSAPPPLPPIGGAPFEPGFTPSSERLDSTAELVFLYALP